MKTKTIHNIKLDYDEEDEENIFDEDDEDSSDLINDITQRLIPKPFDDSLYLEFQSSSNQSLNNERPHSQTLSIIQLEGGKLLPHALNTLQRVQHYPNFKTAWEILQHENP